jgi:hypothetical protein
MGEAGLARAARWCVTMAAAAALVVIAASAVAFAQHTLFRWWWAAAAGAIILAALGWRALGGRVLALWHAANLPKWVLPTALFAVFFLVKLAPALLLKTEQRADFEVMQEAAESINAGDFSFSEKAYWYFFAYQTPFTIYEAFMLRVFGGSTVPLLVVNALAMAVVNLLVYFAARRITGSAVAGLAAAGAYLVYPGPYLEANALVNDHLSTMFLYTGAFLALVAAAPAKPGTAAGWRRPAALAAAAGLALALGNLARPAGPVVLAALAAALVLAAVIARPKGGSWRPLARSALVGVLAVAVYAAAGQGAGAAIKASGVNPAGAANNLPEWKFVIGLDKEGQVPKDVVAIGAYAATPDPDARAVAQEAVKRNLRQLPQTWKWVLRNQLFVLWALNDTPHYAFNPQLTSAPLYAIPDPETATTAHVMILGERGLFLPVVLLAAWGVVLLNRDRRWGRLALFLALLVTVYFTAHLVIEVLPRYRYLPMPAVFALAAPALGRLAGKRYSATWRATPANGGTRAGSSD